MQTTVAHAIEQATLEVFALMVGVDIVPETQIREDNRGPASNVVSSFKLSGAIRGTAQVFYTLPLAKRITCQMLQVEPPVGDTEVLDAAGEVANMIVGNIKNSLEGRWGSIRIGTPGVALAHHCAETQHAMTVSFRCCEEVFTVSVAFKEDSSRWDN